MEYVILDLEWNGVFIKKNNKYFNEIIEFGAVKLDGQMNEIGRFSMLVRPQVSKKIKGSVETLTSITNEQLKNGSPFEYAVSKFEKFARGAVLMTWSTSDLTTLQENLNYYKKNNRITFMKKYVDLQAYCQSMLGGQNITHQLGLLAAAEMLELDVDDIPHHRAIGDSIVSAECLKKLYDAEKLKAFIQDSTTDEFYQRLNFHNTCIVDINSPLIDKNEMVFDCLQCGKRLEQTADWWLHTKCFVSRFTCSACNEKYIGRIQFKLRYEGMKVTKKIRPETPEDMKKAEQDKNKQSKSEHTKKAVKS